MRTQYIYIHLYIHYCIFENYHSIIIILSLILYSIIILYFANGVGEVLLEEFMSHASQGRGVRFDWNTSIQTHFQCTGDDLCHIIVLRYRESTILIKKFLWTPSRVNVNIETTVSAAYNRNPRNRNETNYNSGLFFYHQLSIIPNRLIVDRVYFWYSIIVFVLGVLNKLIKLALQRCSHCERGMDEGVISRLDFCFLWCTFFFFTLRYKKNFLIYW